MVDLEPIELYWMFRNNHPVGHFSERDIARYAPTSMERARRCLLEALKKKLIYMTDDGRCFHVSLDA